MIRQAGTLWTPDQVNAFLALAKDRYDAQPHATVYPLFYTALAAGLRRGELLGLGRKALGQAVLKGKSQHFLDNYWTVDRLCCTLHSDTPKTESGVRRVPINDALAAVLIAHMLRMDALAEE